MKKIKTGDQVIVIAGKDKGKQGSITKILNNGRCYVSGVQMVKRHTKPNPNAGVAGGVVEKESTINISNISIFNPSTKRNTNFSVILLILPLMIFPSSILTFESWLFNNFSNS
mgnify:CR=1 FL=1